MEHKLSLCLSIFRLITNHKKQLTFEQFLYLILKENRFIYRPKINQKSHKSYVIQNLFKERFKRKKIEDYQLLCSKKYKILKFSILTQINSFVSFVV